MDSQEKKIAAAKISFESGYLKCLLDVCEVIGKENLTVDEMEKLDAAKIKSVKEFCVFTSKYR